MMLDDGIKRRTVLKKSALLGSLSLIGYGGIGTVAAEESSVDVDSVVGLAEVQSIERALPGLELKTDEATSLGEEGFAVSIPANYGTLIVVAPETDPTALFDFDERVPELDVDWPEGTHARLEATEVGPVFQRTATDTEARVGLASIDRSDLLGTEDVHVSVTPETGEIHVTHMDREDRQVEVIHARVTDHSGGSLDRIGTDAASVQVVDREVYSGQEDDSVGTLGCRNCNNLAPDVLLCLTQVQSCSLCMLGSPAPPVAIACIILVCLGGSGGLLLELLADAGCTNLAACAYECFEDEWKNLV